jgi:hypothetical protein
MVKRKFNFVMLATIRFLRMSFYLVSTNVKNKVNL